MTDTNLIKFDDSVSAQALTDLQEHVKLLPAVITTEKEFKTIYDNYQNVRRLRIAVGKQSEGLIKSFKKTFELGKKEIQTKESAVLTTLAPIEEKLKSTREAWEVKKKEIAESEAAELAAEQEKEFIRVDIIKNWDLAHAENQAHDQKILDDIERARKDEELKASADELEIQRLKFEQEKIDFERSKERVGFSQAWDEAHEDAKAINEEEKEVMSAYEDSFADEEAEPTKEGKKVLEKEGVKIGGQEEGQPVHVTLEVICPECGNPINLGSDTDAERYFNLLKRDDWSNLENEDHECIECFHNFKLSYFEY